MNSYSVLYPIGISDISYINYIALAIDFFSGPYSTDSAGIAAQFSKCYPGLLVNFTFSEREHGCHHPAIAQQSTA